jgi:hypothetical protein
LFHGSILLTRCFRWSIGVEDAVYEYPAIRNVIEAGRATAGHNVFLFNSFAKASNEALELHLLVLIRATPSSVIPAVLGRRANYSSNGGITDETDKNCRHGTAASGSWCRRPGAGAETEK